MRWRVIIAVAIIALIYGAGFWWFSNQPKYASHPDSARPWEKGAWEQWATNKRVNPDPIPLGVEAFWESHTFETVEKGRVQLSIPKADWFEAQPPGEFIDLSLPPGSQRKIGLDSIGITMARPESELIPPSYYRARYRYYSATGEPIEDLDDPRISQLFPGMEQRFTFPFCPSIALQFHHEFPNADIQHAEFFDRRSGTRISSRFSWIHIDEWDDGFALRSALLTWKRKDFLAAVDLAYGEFVHRKIPAEVGAVAAWNGISCRLMYRQNGKRPYGGSSNVTTDPVYFKFTPPPAPDSLGNVSTFIFAAHPYRARSGISFAAIDSDGREIPTQTKAHSYRIYMVHCDAPLDQVAGFTVRFRPSFARVLCPIETLPELPPVNDRLSNYFAMKVPYAVIRPEDHDLACGGLAQIQLSNNPYIADEYRDVPLDQYPVYENATVDEMLANYLRMSEPDISIGVVEKDLRFWFTRTPQGKSWWESSKSWIRRRNPFR